MKAESWARLERARKYYESRGFKYRDVSWVVEPEVSGITKPDFCKDFYLGDYDAVLVGSAEQSFLAEYPILNNDNYYALTPCFRDERDYDEYHHAYFMKLELFSKNASPANLLFMRKCAQIFFGQELPFLKKTEIITLGVDDYDLNYRGIELGSYNIKRHKDMEWACGTGLAEPRFSEVLEK